MCGITGCVWTKSSGEVSRSTLDRMVEVLAHRGPDDRGTYLCTNNAEGSGVAFGHTRLAIIDLSANGKQPISNENETIWLTFNGEIYNFEELKKPLVEKGHKFRGTSDSEVLVHLYEELGSEMFAKLNGMFAIAIWDSRKSELVLARDRLGKKPLLYKLEQDRIIFAS
ncbi:MAG: asparagine synthetase B family protein, partial [Thermoguttaceae bacterium]